MSEVVNLNVVFLLKRKNWRNWLEPIDKRWNHSYLSLNSLQISEYDIIPSIRGARKMLKDIDVAIIGGWESPVYIRTILKAKKKKIKVIQFYESTSDSHRFSRGVVAFIRKWILNKVDSVITVSKSSAETLTALGIAPEKIITLFNPVDVSWFYSFARNHRTPVTSGHHYIYVGQLIERKNVATILRSFAAIRNDSDTLTIAGNGPLVRDLKILASSLGIAQSAKFTGHLNQEELANLYAASNTLILASTNEVWGLVVNEALAAGLHVVVSNKCGVAEFVQDMDGAYTCSADQKSLQEAMRTSALQWNGYIGEPEILKFTQERFADGVIGVLDIESL
jgi:glycosyltransferase involved in cell wall biosynthesis